MVTSGILRVVFFGTPEFAVPTLSALFKSRHVVVGVVTQPDRPKGRGQKLAASPVKELALANNTPVLQPQKLRDEEFLVALTALNADLGVVAAYGKILTDAVLQIPRLGLINVHASLLPKYRGAAPIHRAVMAGERETGITIMRVVKALDAGPMLHRVARPIGEDETSVDVERGLAEIGGSALVDIVDRFASGAVDEVPQDESAATYASKIEKSDGVVDWTRSSLEIHNQIRGLYPWPHAYSQLLGQRCLLLASEVSRVAPVLNTTGGDPPTGSTVPGEIIEAHGDRLVVQTGSGILHLTQIQPEGRRPMSTREFLSGRPVAVGQRFTTATLP